MFSKAESSRIRQEFWTTFGLYKKPILSSEGMRINWINYNTKLKDVYFRMETHRKSAEIAISISAQRSRHSGVVFRAVSGTKNPVAHGT